jgi:hypothetical protein
VLIFRKPRCLELELVGQGVAGEGEGSLQVSSHELVLGDAGDDGLIDRLLEGDELSGEARLLLVTSKLSLGLLSGLLGSDGLSEEGVLDLGDVDVSDVDLSGGGDDVGLVDSLERDTVDLVRAGDQEKTRLQLLEENDALTLVSTGEEDEHGTRGNRLSQLGGADLQLVAADGGSLPSRGQDDGLLDHLLRGSSSGLLSGNHAGRRSS